MARLFIVQEGVGQSLPCGALPGLLMRPRVARKRELALARSHCQLGRLLAQLLGISSPLVGELEEQGAAFWVFGLLSGANAFVRVLLVELSEGHGSSSIQARKARHLSRRSPIGESLAAAVWFEFCGLNFGHRSQVRPYSGAVRFTARHPPTDTRPQAGLSLRLMEPVELALGGRLVLMVHVSVVNAHGDVAKRVAHKLTCRGDLCVLIGARRKINEKMLATRWNAASCTVTGNVSPANILW